MPCRLWRWPCDPRRWKDCIILFARSLLPLYYIMLHPPKPALHLRRPPLKRNASAPKLAIRFGSVVDTAAHYGTSYRGQGSGQALQGSIRPADHSQHLIPPPLPVPMVMPSMDITPSGYFDSEGASNRSVP